MAHHASHIRQLALESRPLVSENTWRAIEKVANEGAGGFCIKIDSSLSHDRQVKYREYFVKLGYRCKVEVDYTQRKTMVHITWLEEPING